MLFVRQAFRKDLSRSLKDRVALVLYLGIPLVIGGMLLLLIGGDGPKPVAQLLVVDEDETVASDLFQTLLRSEQMSEFISVKETSLAEGRQQIDDGEASALLVIPKGFQDAVLREEPAELELITNPAETIKPKILTVGMEVLVDAVFYLHRVLGEELRTIVDIVEREDAPDEEAIANVSVEISRVIRKIERYAFPPAITVEAVADENDRTGGVPMAHLMLPGVVLMGLLLMAQGLAGDVWEEKNGGTLSRMVSAPQPVASLLLGKILADAVLVFVVSLVLLTVGMLVLEMPLMRLPVALAWTTLSGVTFILLFMWISVHTRTRRAGTVITNSLVYPLLMLGGSFFPSETMPEWMGAAGRLTPNGWSLENLKGILIGSADGTVLSMGIVGLFAAALLLFYLTAARMRGRFARL